LHSWVFMARFHDSILLSSGLGVTAIESTFPPSASPRPPGQWLVRAEGSCFWWSCGTVQRRIHRTESRAWRSWLAARVWGALLGWETLLPSTKVTSLNLNWHFVFQNRNASGKRCFKNGVSFPGTGTSYPPDTPGWQLLGTWAKIPHGYVLSCMGTDGGKAGDRKSNRTFLKAANANRWWGG